MTACRVSAKSSFLAGLTGTYLHFMHNSLKHLGGANRQSVDVQPKGRVLRVNKPTSGSLSINVEQRHSKY